MASINSKERQETSLEEGASENILKNKNLSKLNW
jgi:hypothetical protein